MPRRGSRAAEPEKPAGTLLFEEGLRFTPLSCFALLSPLYPIQKGKHWEKKHLLPDHSKLSGEESFAKLSVAYRDEAFLFFAEVESGSVVDCHYPAVGDGDSVELFLYTREPRGEGYLNQYGHHFFFLPKEAGGREAGELTRFRTEDRHEWCDASLLRVQSRSTKRGYTMEGTLPAECLVGWNPAEGEKIAFTYRINRAEGSSQHFAVTSADYPRFEQYPHLWALLEYHS